MYEYWRSDYAINVKSSGIVYRSVTGEITEVSIDVFLSSDTKLTNYDFYKIKEFSDEDYHLTNNLERREESHCLNYYEEAFNNITVDSLDDIITERLYNQEKIRKINYVFQHELSSIQKRRLLYSMQGLSTRQIARIECVDQKAIVKSLCAARKKIKKKVCIEADNETRNIQTKKLKH